MKIQLRSFASWTANLFASSKTWPFLMTSAPYRSVF